ncbi:hypothetical protein MMYC01_200430 [Madurella mycetomatis]|uniref:Uncharacterized protein n=1 Tax=Madurella mycetomatis TaxID=100816 RepID=A0A175WHK9_9PEZI|nr:hypothetical protein MMYC01_200430 [Madurella mycetomatis]
MESVGHQMAETDRKDHHQRAPKGVPKYEGQRPNYFPKTTELRFKLEGHIKDEEGCDLPALEKLSPEASKSMAKSFARTKRFAPPRSHPSMGEHPPFETIINGPADRPDRLPHRFVMRFPEKPPQADIDQPAGPASTLHD